MGLIFDIFLGKIRSDKSSGGSGGGGTYNGISPTTVTVGGLPAGSAIAGMTFEQIIQGIVAPYVSPSFSSFVISGQAQVVEIGTTITAPKTFTWGVNLGSGTVPTIDIYNNTLGNTTLSGTPNDGVQSVTIPTVNFTAQGQQQSYKGIGFNSQNSSNFSSANFVITGSYLEFYGPTAFNSATSADVRALPNSRFENLSNNFTMNTGTTQTIFEIVMRATKTLTSVIDTTTGFAVPIGSGAGNFVLSTINVNDAAGNSIVYNLYRLTNTVPYSSNHVFSVTTN